MQPYLRKVVERIDLTEEEAQEAMQIIMTGQATAAQLACLVTALKMKGEKAAEITGLAKVMRQKVTPVCCQATDIVDTCGTGGDDGQTFNISTTAAFIAAGCGLPVAKHGNRSVSSQCGSADVLEALGVNINLSPQEMAGCIDNASLGFLFAPILHQSMQYALKPRQEIGIRTVFNLLGPLTNPAGAKRQLLGVYSPDLTETLAEVLLELGTKHAWVVHGLDGLDEISLSSKTQVTEVKNGKLRTFILNPADYGLKVVPLAALKGGSPQENAAIILNILQNREKGPTREIALLNAAAVLVVGGLADDLKEGLALARKSLGEGKALAVLEKLAVRGGRRR